MRVAELRQFFNAIDPSPSLDRDLDPRAEAFIVDGARDLATNESFELLVHLGRASCPTTKPHYLAAPYTVTSTSAP